MKEFKKLVILLMENRSDFISSIEYRQRTSVFNKQTHQEVIDAVKLDNLDLVLSLISQPTYRINPLYGVIICSDYFDFDLKCELLEIYEEALSSKDWGELIWETYWQGLSNGIEWVVLKECSGERYARSNHPRVWNNRRICI